MANLTYIDKGILEKAFNMSTGYVLQFSDRTFADCVSDILHFNVHEKYTGSKANKMRQIWKNESNVNVATLLEAIIKMYPDSSNNEIKNIIDRLKNSPISITNHDNINDYQHLPYFIKGAWEDLSNERYWEVITKARTILEITFKEICIKCNLNFDDKNINTTFTRIRKHFGMDAKSENYPDYIKGLINHSTTLVNSIAEARNKNSSAHAPEYTPIKHHAQFCLEQSISLMNFIISIYEYKSNNICKGFF